MPALSNCLPTTCDRNYTSLYPTESKFTNAWRTEIKSQVVTVDAINDEGDAFWMTPAAQKGIPKFARLAALPVNENNGLAERFQTGLLR
jgi:hypothetical protein